jgi:hypothetical protein
MQIYETVYTKKYKQGIFFNILVKNQFGSGLQDLLTQGYVGKPFRVNSLSPDQLETGDLVQPLKGDPA